MIKSIDEIDFEKSGGLVPVIVQDANTKDILTLAYANKESLELAKKLVILGFGAVQEISFG